MKHVTVILLIFLSCNAYSQTAYSFPLDSLSGKVSFDKVISIDSTDSEELYSRALILFSENFVNADKVIDLKDPTSGTVIGKGLDYVYTDMGFIGVNKLTLYFTLKLQVKDQRYRYTITDIYLKNTPSQYELYPKKIALGLYSSILYPKKKKDFKYNESVYKTLTNLEALIVSAMLKASVEDW
jgi:hypothetical protein